MGRATSAQLALFTSAALCASCRAPSSDEVALYLEAGLGGALGGAMERRLDTDVVRIEPADNVRSARLDARGRLLVARKDAAKALRVTAPGLCPVDIPAGPRSEPLPLRPLLDLGGDRGAVGFDKPFTVKAQHNCPERDRGSITWRQLDGPPLAEWRVSDAGFVLSARTARFADVHPEPLSEGIVPISPRTQARVVLEAQWRGPGLEPTSARVAIAATPRSTGLSSVAVSQQLVLAGVDWQVQGRPRGGHANVVGSEGLSFFTADAPGRWTLAHAGRDGLTLQALRHDLTPYDCGRSECHAEIAALTARSPMSRALSTQLSQPEAAQAASCMLQCHVVGEPGLNDGGFHDVARQLGFTWTQHTRWQDLPQPLRRLGGVRCTSCHGPGAIPPPGGRAAVLRADVCATCHDAPPRYVHVQQWRSSRMARADQHAGARDPACARCHTTAGFLAHLGARAHADDLAGAEPVGIACAACHAPHARARGDRLVRLVPGAAWAGAASPPAAALCVACHAPLPEFAGSAAPSGTLLSPTVQVPAPDGDGWQALQGGAAHRELARGCLACHGAGPGPQSQVDHSFRVAPSACDGCHLPTVLQVGRERSRQLTQRALSLSAELALRCGVDAALLAPHPQRAARKCGQPGLERARYEAALVLEDPAAAFHDAELSRALLEDAARRLEDDSSM